MYPYAAVSQIRNMLKIFRDHKESFRFMIEAAIKTWSDIELDFLAESLVLFFLCEPDSDTPYDALMDRMADIVDIDIRLCKEACPFDQIQYSSFSVKILNQIVKLPEARHYVQKTLNKFYDEIDYKYIQKIDFDKLNSSLKKKSTNKTQIIRMQTSMLEDENTLEYVSKYQEPSLISYQSTPSGKNEESEFSVQIVKEQSKLEADFLFRFKFLTILICRNIVQRFVLRKF